MSTAVRLTDRVSGTLEESLPGKNGDRINHWYLRRADHPDEFHTELRSYINAIVVKLTRMNSKHFEEDDLVQDAWLKVHETLDSFRGESKFSSWVYRLTRNVFVDETRRVSRRHLHFLDSSDGDESIDIGCLSSPKAVFQEERSIHVQLGFQLFEAKQSAEDREILEGWLNREQACETADRLGLKAKRVNYRRQIIRDKLLAVWDPAKSASISQPTDLFVLTSRQSDDVPTKQDAVGTSGSAAGESVPESSEFRSPEFHHRVGNPDSFQRLSEEAYSQQDELCSFGPESEYKIGNSEPLERLSGERAAS